MASFTVIQWVQILAALTLPLGLFVMVLSRLAGGKPKLLKPFKWKHMMMAILWAVVPALVIFGLQGYFSQWIVGGGIALVVVIAMLNVGSSGD